MTQKPPPEFEELEKEEHKIIERIQKVRQLTLRRLLLYFLNGGKEKYLPNVKTRRAKYDYKLAFNIVVDIVDLHEKGFRLSLKEPEVMEKVV